MEATETNWQPIEELVLVFDADAGAISALVDSARKLFRLNGCSLCSITHGLTGESNAWKHCKDEMGVPVDYLHRDELTDEIAGIVDQRFPCVLARARGRTEFVMGPDVLERCAGSVPDFKGRLLHHAARFGLCIESGRTR